MEGITNYCRIHAYIKFLSWSPITYNVPVTNTYSDPVFVLDCKKILNKFPGQNMDAKQTQQTQHKYNLAVLNVAFY